MEKLLIELEFDSEWEESAPFVEIFNNNIKLVNLTKISDKTIIRFDLELMSNLDCELEIKRTGHNKINQQICQFRSFKVDDIDITPILDHGKFYPIYPEPWFTEQKQQDIDWPEYHLRWRDWGWNGSWKLHYKTPFYTWLLKVI